MKIMVKNFFSGTPWEFQIYTNEKPIFYYDNSIQEPGVFTNCLMCGWITICWGTYKGE